MKDTKLDKTFNYGLGCIGLVGIVATVVTLFVAITQPTQVITILQQVAGGTPTPVVIVVTSAAGPAPSAPGPLPTYTPYPTYTPFPERPSQALPTATSAPRPTNTPVGMTSQVFQVKGETATWGPLETGLYIQSGDHVQISYISGEWWIAQHVAGGSQSQSPTDANGYTGRVGDQATALIGDDPDRCRPLVSAPFGSLIGRIGPNGALFLIGNNLEFVAQDSGLLYLRINYSDHNQINGCPYGDGGVISTRVSITPP